MAWKDNVNYKVRIQNHGMSAAGAVVAYIPENFALRLQNQWEQVFSNLLQNNTIADFASGFTGAAPFIKELTGHVWRGTEAITFQLKLLFDAVTDVNADVYAPIEKLVTWASPYQANSVLLAAPGPNLMDQTERLSLRIGRFMYFDSVIISNMDVQFETAMHSSGIPIAAEVDIEFRTFYTLTRDDILAIFSGGRQGWDFNELTTSTPLSLSKISQRIDTLLAETKRLSNMPENELIDRLIAAPNPGG